MYGPSVDSLNVYLKKGTTLGDAVFHRERTQGPKWNQATVDITGVTGVQVRANSMLTVPTSLYTNYTTIYRFK